MFTRRSIVSPRKWRKQRQKKRVNDKRLTKQEKHHYLDDNDVIVSDWRSSKILPRESSKSYRNIRGRYKAKESQRESFINKSGSEYKPAASPFIKPLSLDRIKRETPKPYIVSSEDWSTTSSASEFVHIKPETSRSKLKHTSSIKQLLMEDMHQKLGNNRYGCVDQLKFYPQESSDISVCQLDLKDETTGVPPSFINLATWRVKSEDQVDFQISIWKVRNSSTKYITLDSLSQYDCVVIEKSNPKYTFIQTSKLISSY